MSILPILQRRRERRLLRERASSERQTRISLGCGLVFSILLGLGIFGFALGYASLTSDLPSIEALPALLDPPDGLLYQPSRIYDRTGQYLLTVLAPQDAPRQFLPLDSTQGEALAPDLVALTLALTDPGFYSHPGYLLTGWTSPDLHPTLAQKLSADLLLWQEPASPRRALRERILAAQITARFGREKILEWYLNTADYGRQAYGAQAAAQLYFGKPASQLNLAEAALLVAVAQSPAINPLDAPEAATQRARDLLNQLPASAEVTAAQQANLQYQTVAAPVGLAPAFTALALSQLGQDVSLARIARGGMIVITSLDFERYQQAQCALRIQQARLSGLPDPTDCQLLVDLAALPPGPALDESAVSAVVLNPQNGQVLAIVGEMRQGLESALLTGHRPGTSLIPFFYLAGFSRGLSPASLVWDIPQAESVIPNLDGIYHGPVRARLALTHDYLAPAQSILAQMSLPTALQTMRPFGFQLTDTRDFAALLDGQNFISPLTMAQAYGVFAANGMLPLRLTTVLEVRSLDGQTVFTAQPAPGAALVSPQLSYLMNHVLAVDSLGLPAALKVSQTLDGADTWAVGYTPTRAVALWMGGGAPPSATRGLFAALLQSANQGETPLGWEQPVGVSPLLVCDPSGLLPTATCPNVVSEVFLTGYEPVQPDTLYKTYAVNRETGFLATVFTLSQLVEERVYMVVPPEAANWAAGSGVATPPTMYDNLQPPVSRPDLAISAPAMFALLRGQVIIHGSAAGEGFAYYRLQYGQGLNPTAWILLGENRETPVTEAVLGEWDIRGLKGLYALQLVVVRQDGRVETTAVQVEIGP